MLTRVQVRSIMKVKIYQLPVEHERCFRSFEHTERGVDSQLYEPDLLFKMRCKDGRED